MMSTSSYISVPENLAKRLLLSQLEQWND